MALTRLTDGQYLGVSTALNSWAQQIDYLSVSCLLQKTANQSMDPNTNYVISWDSVGLDTFGGMWAASDPTAITVRYNGIYQLLLQVRYPYWGTTSPWNTGTRAAQMLLNSTVPTTGVIAADRKSYSISGEGVTLNLSATMPMLNGHKVYANAIHTADATLTKQLAQDFGGTYMALSWIGPYTP